MLHCAIVAILAILAILNLHVAFMPSIKFLNTSIQQDPGADAGAEWSVFCTRYCKRDFCPVFYSCISEMNTMLPQYLAPTFSSV